MPVKEVKAEREDEAEIVELAKKIKEANKARANQVTNRYIVVSLFFVRYKTKNGISRFKFNCRMKLEIKLSRKKSDVKKGPLKIRGKYFLKPFL